MNFEALEESVESRASTSIAKFLDARQKIHERFENDPHVTEDPGRV
jgi:hypothetical protein